MAVSKENSVLRFHDLPVFVNFQLWTSFKCLTFRSDCYLMSPGKFKVCRSCQSYFTSFDSQFYITVKSLDYRPRGTRFQPQIEGVITWSLHRWRGCKAIGPGGPGLNRLLPGPLVSHIVVNPSGVTETKQNKTAHKLFMYGLRKS